MTRKPTRKPSGRTQRRNPHARALGAALFRERVVKDPKAYRRKPRHPKPVGKDEGET